MVRIRFRRMGLKRQPVYRIVVTDQRKARGGAYLEVIGHHNPRTEPATDILNEGRALYWLSVGAQPSDAVKQLMMRTGTLDRLQRLRSGEDMEALVAEALAAKEAAGEISPRTDYPAPAPGEGRGARYQEKQAALAEAEASGNAEEEA